MKKHFMKRSLTVLLSLALISAAACSKTAGDSALLSESTSSTTHSTTTTKMTEKSSTKKTEATTKKAEVLLSKLSGRVTTPEENARRVICVMLDNHPNARQQAGIRQADIVYEMKVEGTYTRYMAVYQSQDAPLVGPIRSSREYFLDRMLEYKAVYAHVGGSAPALARIQEMGYDDLDGLVLLGSTMWRYGETGKVAPHNAYSDLANLRAQSKEYGYAEKEDIPGYKFNQEAKAPAGSAATNVELQFAFDNQTVYTYRPESGLYDRYKDGDLQVDENDGQTLDVRNIIIQVAPYSHVDEKLLAVAHIGEGEGIYVSMGKQLPLTWSKKSTEAPTQYFVNGKELVLNPGQTWIEVCDIDTGIAIN